VSELVVLLADPSRAAYEEGARRLIEHDHGWQLRLPRGFDAAELLALAPEAEVLVTRRRRVEPEVLAAAPRLRALLHLGRRVDPALAAAAAARGLVVEAFPTRGTLAVAEHTMALMLACTRALLVGDRATRGGHYRQLGRQPRPTDEVEHGFQWLGLTGISLLAGKRLGLVGFGEIGETVAGMARAFGMEVRYHRRQRLSEELERELGVSYLPFEELVRTSDVLSLHLPHTRETEGMIDERVLGLLPPGAVLVNTARGGLIDEGALVRRLRTGELTAGLDVFAFEPLPADHPLVELENVVLSPHVAAAPARGLVEMLEGLVPRLQALAGAPSAASQRRIPWNR
jgi:glyoxylate reductase